MFGHGRNQIALNYRVFLPTNICHDQITDCPRSMFGLNHLTNAIARHYIATGERAAIRRSLHPGTIRSVLRQDKRFDDNLTIRGRGDRNFVRAKTIVS